MKHPFTIDLGYLHALRALREHGTITAAAAALHLTPSAVSQQLHVLSRSVGVPLLVRHGRLVRLTPQALVLLEHAEILHAQLERTRADLAGQADGQVGRLMIGAFATAISGVVAPALAELSAVRPRLEVMVQEMQAPECFTRLDSGELDLAITVEWRDAPHRGDPRYARRDLLRDPLDVALPATHPLARRSMVRLDDLAAQPWIAGAPGSPCAEVALAACATAGFNPRVRHVTEDWNAVIALVRAGAGVALIPRLALPTRPEGIVIRTLGQNGPARRIFAAVRAGSERSALIAPTLAALADIAGRKRPAGPAPPTPKGRRSRQLVTASAAALLPARDEGRPACLRRPSAHH